MSAAVMTTEMLPFHQAVQSLRSVQSVTDLRTENLLKTGLVLETREPLTKAAIVVGEGSADKSRFSYGAMPWMRSGNFATMASDGMALSRTPNS
jgi:hypothetical protein